MARAGVAFEQVSAVAEELTAKGLQPTIRLVREWLGDRGSPNTIQRHLSAWREARPAVGSIVLELPSALSVAIAAEISRAAAQARSEIEGQLAQAQLEAADLAMAGEALEAERDACIGQMAGLTTERDTLAGKAAQQAADLAELSARLEREQQAAEAARVELSTARLKLEGQAERLAVQTADLDRLRVALESERKGRVVAELEAAVLAARLEAAEILSARAEAKSESSERLAGEAVQEMRQVRADREEARAASAQARELAARLSGQVDMLQAESKHRDATEAALSAEVERLRALLGAPRTGDTKD